MATLVAPPAAPTSHRFDVQITLTGSMAVDDHRRPPRPRLLVVEPDGSLRAAFSSALAADGHEVAAVDCVRAARAARPATFDCVVLDRAAGEGDALTLVDELYGAGGRTRVVLVAGRASDAERVEGLTRGADDYLVQPVELPELVTRVRRLTRCRAVTATAQIRVGRVVIDQDRRLARMDGQEVDLTPTQYELLVELAREPGCVVQARRLIERGWDDHRDLDTSVLRPHLTRLRKALQGAVEVRCVRGVGYALEIVGTTVAAVRACAADDSGQLALRDGARAKTG